ncbi:MAG: type II secretion system F family protein [Deferribacteraceae bacterium]|jgi:type II secretory pathway component PulF|nr:type II secretion system F family protein [Deferribacteraceae bacterium]
MATFHYKGVTKTGKNVKGYKDSVSKQAALSELVAEGIFIEEIKISGNKNKSSFISNFKSSKKNLADYFFQLSLLLRSGIPLVEAQGIIARTTESEKEKGIIMDSASKVSEGMRFSDALAQHEDYYSPMYVNLIKASENIGRLSAVLMDIATYEENKRANADKLTSALVYPIVILLIGIGVLVFMLTIIVPKMRSIFDAAGREIPLMTKILLSLSGFVQRYGLYFFLLAVTAVFLFRYFYKQNDKFRMRVDERLFKSDLVAQSAITRFAHILAFQLREGLPLTDALYYATQTMTNKYFRRVLEDVRKDVQSGVKFSKSVKDAKIFPELFPAAVSTGESSGNMPELLERVTEFYGKKLEKQTSAVLSVLEPLFIVLIGLMVGFVVIAIMVPLMNMGSLAG